MSAYNPLPTLSRSQLCTTYQTLSLQAPWPILLLLIGYHQPKPTRAGPSVEVEVTPWPAPSPEAPTPFAPAPTPDSAAPLALAPNLGAPTPLPEAPAPLAPAPSPSAVPLGSPSPLGGPVNLTLQLQGTDGLNSSGLAALQAALANFTGQSVSSFPFNDVLKLS